MKRLTPTILAVTTLMSTSCSAAPARVSASAEPVQGPRIYTFESDGNGFNTKTFFYDNGQEVVAFDTQFTPDAARKAIAELRTKTQNPITAVVVTHPNPDKFNGMKVFQDLGAKVIASRKTAENMPGVHAYKKYFFVQIAKMFTDETYPALSSPDVTFESTYDLTLRNGEIITLRELAEPGVSTNQTVAYLPQVNAVVVGDLVHSQAHAWLEGGIVGGKATPTLKGWISDLKQLQDQLQGKPETIVYGGRGQALPAESAIKAQILYLKKADRLVSRYIERLGDRRGELKGDLAQKHYQAITEEFKAAFPGYELPYMIQYGVYGLVNSKL